MRWFLVFLIPVLLLSACESSQLSDGPEVQPPPAPELRPQIPRVDVPTSTPPTPTQPSTQYGELRSFLNSTLHYRTGPRGLIVGQITDPFLFGDKLGDILPILTRTELPFLAAPNPNPDPRLARGPFHAEQFVRFDFDDNTSGELRYVRDPDTERVESELFFEEDKPMFEYAYLLEEGNFHALMGSEIEIFGGRYWVKEVHDDSLELYGVDVEQYVFFSNDSSLKIDGERMPDTDVRVDQWSVIVTYYADDPDEDGIRLKTGENLRSKLRKPEALLNPIFDIFYDGLEENQQGLLVFENRGSEVEITFQNILGEQRSFRTGCGAEEDFLHTKECDDDFCIADEERFLLTSRQGVTDIFEFRGVNEIGTVLTLRDHVSGDEHVVEVEYTTRNQSGLRVLEGELRLDSVHRLRVLHNETARGNSRLEIDLNADGGIGRDVVPIVLPGSNELEFEESYEAGCNLTFTSPRIPDFDKESFNIELRRTGELLIGTDVVLHEIGDDTEVWEGVTERGILLRLEESEDGELGEELSVNFAPDFTAGLVRILG